MLCSTSESSHVVLFRVRVTRGFEGTSYSNWATRHTISWDMSIFRAQWARKHETKQIARHPFRRTLMIVYTVCIDFWRSWNLRLFLVHHKKCFLHLRGLQQSSCIYRASPKNISWNLWCLEHLFWKVNNNILESYWTYRFPTLYQTTILGTRWDLEDTRVINIKKSCQANYQ